MLGESLIRAAEFEEAETVLLRGYEICQENGIDSDGILEELTSLYEKWGKPEEAEHWRSQLADEE